MSEETRKIEFTESVKLSAVVSVHPGNYAEGDVKTFPKAEADQYIGFGWAKCCATGEQGERKPGSHKLEVQNVTSGVTTVLA